MADTLLTVGVMLKPSLWSRFVVDWNVTLQRRPTNVIAGYLSSQSLTWGTLYTGLAASAVTFPPELAVGWMAARLTRRMRMPINVAIAAGAVRVAPALSALTVTPLLTGLQPGDAKALDAKWMSTRAYLEGTQPVGAHRDTMRGVMDRIEGFGRWVQGPVDQYGLALFLSGKVSWLATLLTVSVATRHGLDIQPTLVWLGMGADGLQSSMGCLAAAAGMNIAFTPAHFYLAVKGAQAQEALAMRLAPMMVELEAEAEAKKRQEGAGNGGGGEGGDGPGLNAMGVHGRDEGGGEYATRRGGRDGIGGEGREGEAGEAGGKRGEGDGEESEGANSEADWFENFVSIQAMALFGITLAVNLFGGLGPGLG